MASPASTGSARFRQYRLALFGTVMGEEAQAVVRGWHQAARTGEPVNVSAWMHRLTFHALSVAPSWASPQKAWTSWESSCRQWGNNFSRISRLL